MLIKSLSRSLQKRPLVEGAIKERGNTPLPWNVIRNRDINFVTAVWEAAWHLAADCTRKCYDSRPVDLQRIEGRLETVGNELKKGEGERALFSSKAKRLRRASNRLDEGGREDVRSELGTIGSLWNWGIVEGGCCTRSLPVHRSSSFETHGSRLQVATGRKWNQTVGCDQMISGWEKVEMINNSRWGGEASVRDAILERILCTRNNNNRQ